LQAQVIAKVTWNVYPSFTAHGSESRNTARSRGLCTCGSCENVQLWVPGRACAHYRILICFSDISPEFVLAATTTAYLSCSIQKHSCSNAFEMAGTWAALRFSAVYVLATLLRTTLARRTILQGASAPAAEVASVTEYTWHVTLSSQAPDCFQRNVILVNGSFQPTLEVVQGDFLKVCCKCQRLHQTPSCRFGMCTNLVLQLVMPLPPALH